MTGRRIVAIALSWVVLMTPALVALERRATAQEVAELKAFIGALHEHSAYSDGFPGSRPAHYYRSAKDLGIDFLGSAEHSDNLQMPITLSEYCLPDQGGTPADCALADREEPTNSLTKWDAMKAQAEAATDASFTGFRGFEWSSERHGHINVYFSQNLSNAWHDGGLATMESFYEWLSTSPAAGGGGDGLATFNHSGGKKLHENDPAFNWNGFEYRPEIDRRMVGHEVFNGTRDYGDPDLLAQRTTLDGRPGSIGWYSLALDRGWHVGAIGAEDKGHDHTDGDGQPDPNGVADDWGGSKWAKTVVLATDRSAASLRRAMLARHFYAVLDNSVRMEFTGDGEMMGTQLVRPGGTTVPLAFSINASDVSLELITNGGVPVMPPVRASELTFDAEVTPEERYYFVRVVRDGKAVAYSSPIWVRARNEQEVDRGDWLAGDLHVHTTYSHDSWGGPLVEDDNTGPEEFYVLGLTTAQQFAQAETRGLDFLAITDHNDVRSQSDPGFGTDSVIPVPGYENSLNGHAQMIGATKVYDNGDKSPTSVSALAEQLRRDGGAFQINHPKPGTANDEDMDWGYGYDVVPDTVEVWNISRAWQAPAPSSTNNHQSVRYWEGFLNRGYKVGATGGSDSHWASTSAAQGPGNPTTWVYSQDRTVAGVLEGIREGRTFITAQVPRAQAPLVELEADADGNGIFESMVGDTVPPGTGLQAHVEGSPGALLRVFGTPAEGVDDTRTKYLEVPITSADFSYQFTVPEEVTWARAEIYQRDARDERAASCDQVVGTQTTLCRTDIAVLAMTSPIYLEKVPEPTELVLAQPGGGQFTDTVNLWATLMSAGRPLADRDVVFALGSQEIATTTDAAGTAAVTIPLTDPPGSYELSARFEATDEYEPSSVSGPFVISPEGTVVTYTGAGSTRDKTIELAARLTEDDGPPLAGRTITFTIEDVTYSAVTDATGTAGVTVPAPKKGRSVIVTVSYPGDGSFSASQTETTVTREKGKRATGRKFQR